ncbi:tail fiber domain-containing protein [Burkholderia ubonensis]|uniref:tail fiber domain-containing protein n=1 Tax=Burkholderia ubonensis TaxID=101571 RepID=UPI000A5690E9|nr:tail fiber domain-containing protein [Burkholderia ubonensis]
MSDLQKINQGTAPTGTDGDTVRVGFSKVNANTDVLSKQIALTSLGPITAPQALTPDHMGKRVNFNLASAGTITLPPANTCAADQVTLIRNLGSVAVSLAVADRSGDTLAISQVAAGESVLLDSNGDHAWGVLMRGRPASDNETVPGKLAVGADTAIGGSLDVAGDVKFAKRPTFAGKTPYDTGNLSPVDTSSDQTIGGTKTFSNRPTFAGKVPWDSGNLNPANYAGVGGATFIGGITSTYVPSYWGSAIFVSGELGGAFVEWPKTPTALRMECGQNGAAYKWLHAQHSGERDLAAVGVYAGGSASSMPSIYFSLFGSQNQFQFYANGNATFSGALTQYSDYRIKTNVTEIDPAQALAAVCAARPIEYDRTDLPPNSPRMPGFIAHELQQQFPLLVSGEKDAVKDEMQDFSQGPPRPAKKVPDLQGVNYIGIAPYHTAAIQALEARVAKLEAAACK